VKINENFLSLSEQHQILMTTTNMRKTAIFKAEEKSSKRDEY
jgi:hypothetical protein